MKEENVKEEMKLILELMKANHSFDVGYFEDVLSRLEKTVGNELDRSDEQKIEQEFAENVQKAILKAVDGKPNLDMIGIIEQIISQAVGEYRGLKTKYMTDAASFFLNYLDSDKTKTLEKEIDKELEDDEQS